VERRTNTEANFISRRQQQRFCATHVTLAELFRPIFEATKLRRENIYAKGVRFSFLWARILRLFKKKINVKLSNILFLISGLNLVGHHVGRRERVLVSFIFLKILITYADLIFLKISLNAYFLSAYIYI
jgi:hypothetical protein